MKQRPYLIQTTEQRFWAKVKITEGCWLWTRGAFWGGYGRFKVKGKYYGAHRFSWELTHGPIPPGMCVLHTCDVPPCVRPEHLFLGTNYENIKDRDRKGRGAQGERNGRAKLTGAEVKEIRSLKGTASQAKLARMFGISYGQMSDIMLGKKWKAFFGEL